MTDVDSWSRCFLWHCIKYCIHCRFWLAPSHPHYWIYFRYITCWSRYHTAAPRRPWWD